MRKYIPRFGTQRSFVSQHRVAWVAFASVLLLLQSGMLHGAERRPSGAPGGEPPDQTLGVDRQSHSTEHIDRLNGASTEQRDGGIFLLDKGTPEPFRFWIGDGMAAIFEAFGYPRNELGDAVTDMHMLRDSSLSLCVRSNEMWWGWSSRRPGVVLMRVDIFDDLLMLSNGIAIGSSREEVLRVLGPPDISLANGEFDSFVLTAPSVSLSINYTDDIVRSILLDCVDCGELFN